MHRQRRYLRLEQLEDRCLLSYTITEIGTLGGPSSVAGAINAVGQVAGTSGTADNAAVHLFLYGDGNLADLRSLGGSASSINTLAQIVGIADVDNHIGHAFL